MEDKKMTEMYGVDTVIKGYELKPCPFCGGKAEFLDEDFASPMEIRCTMCDAKIIAYLDECKEDIINYWNTRNGEARK